jgi:hypothetical protein
LLSDALDSIVTTSFKLKKVGIALALNQLMDDDFGIAFELSLLTSNVKNLRSLFDSFLSFLRTYERRKTHNMFSLMLDSQFKNLCLVSSFVDHEQDI